MRDLRSILEKHGFRFKKQFGQNFLSDDNLLRSIVAASGLDNATTVVEIGCGAGTLTRALAGHGADGTFAKLSPPILQRFY